MLGFICTCTFQAASGAQPAAAVVLAFRVRQGLLNRDARSGQYFPGGHARKCNSSRLVTSLTVCSPLLCCAAPPAGLLGKHEQLEPLHCVSRSLVNLKDLTEDIYCIVCLLISYCSWITVAHMYSNYSARSYSTGF